MKLLVFAALLVIASADVSHLGQQYGAPSSRFQYGAPSSSYDVSHKSVTGATASPDLHLPVRDFQDFNAQLSNFGISGSSTPSPILGSGFGFTTPAPSIDLNQGFVSSTPAPNVEINNLGFSTTAGPIGFDGGLQGFSGGLQGFNEGLQGFNLGANQGLVSSTIAPTFDSGFQGFNFNGQVPNARLGFAQSPLSYNLGINSFSTPAPDFDANSFVVQDTSAGGNINDAFGVSVEAANAQQQEVANHVYFYSAPEDHEQVRTRINIAPAQSAKKNVKYIFIKAPAAPTAGPVEIAPPPQAEEKTVVYVLVKKPEAEQQIFVKSPEPTAAAKPEVFFIKYKNQQEAEEAITKVQSGQAGAETHQAATDLSGSDHLLETINRESSFKAQPIVNYVKYDKPFSNANTGFISSNVVPNAGFNSGLSYTTSLPAFNQGFSYTTPAPSLNLNNAGFNSGLSYSTSLPAFNQGFSYTTPAPSLNANNGFRQFHFNSPSFGSGFSYSTPTPTVNIGGLRAFDFQSRADLGQNLISSDFGNSIVSSTEAPSIIASSTVAPEFQDSNVQSEVVGTSSPAPFSTYGAPDSKK